MLRYYSGPATDPDWVQVEMEHVQDQIFLVDLVEAVERGRQHLEDLGVTAGMIAGAAHDASTAALIARKLGFQGQAYARVVNGRTVLVLRGIVTGSGLSIATFYPETHKKLLVLGVGELGQGILRLRHDSTLSGAAIELERSTGGGWTQIVDVGTGWSAAGAMFRVTMKIVLHASTGSVEVWEGENKIIDFSGNTLGGSGETMADRCILESSDHAGSNGSLEIYASEVLVDSEDPRAKRVVTLQPTADGDDTDWDNGFAAIDELEINDTDLISSGTADEVQNFVAANLNAAWSEYGAQEIRVTARALRAETGPQNLQLNLRTGPGSPTTNYFSATKSLGLSFAPVSASWTTNPDTGAAWENSDIDALQYGVKSIT